MRPLPHLAAAAGIVGVLLATSACTAEPGDSELREITIAVDAPASIAFTDPNFNHGLFGNYARQGVYEPLVRWDQSTNDAVPWLATGCRRRSWASPVRWGRRR